MKRYSLLFFLFLFANQLAFGGFNPFSKILFVENKGQWPNQVRFKMGLKGHQVWLEDQALTFQILNADAHPLGQIHALGEKRKLKNPNRIAHNYRIRFVGSKIPKTEGREYQATTFNYFLDNDPAKWVSGAGACEAVSYYGLYEGIDLKLYSEGQRLKYDFYLKPNSDARQIKMQYDGVDGLRLEGGKLMIPTSLGTVVERLPKAYQVIDGQAQNVRCQFVLEGKTVGFSFPDGLNSRYPTVIDPIINFFTYSGSQVDNWGNTAVSDSAGNAYTAGTVYGAFYPATLGAYDRTFNGNPSNPYSTYDIGILKFDPTGKKLLWCTYLGGASADTPYSLAIDMQQNLMVMGSTSSTNFPTSVGAFQRTHKRGPIESPYGSSPGFAYPEYTNGSDLFVSRVQADGKKLLASTFIGGSGTDGLMTISDRLTANYGDQFRGDVLVGVDGSVYIASHTKSVNFPTLAAFQSQLRGVQDGVILKMNPSLSQLIWSTYVGGSRLDALYSLQLIGDEKIVVAGGSTSTDFPTGTDAYQTLGSGNSVDAVLAVFSQQTGQLLGGTYSQTPAYDQAYLVQADDAGNIYVFGQTKGRMPVSQDIYAQAGGGQFLQKFSPTLTTLLWGTTFGTTPGQPNLVPTALLVDSCNHIFLSGWGGIINYEANEQFAGGLTFGLPVTSDAFQSGTDGSDFYFMVLNQNAKALIFGSYYGASGGRGEHVDGGTSRFDRRGIVTQAICGCVDEESHYFHGTPGSFEPDIQSDNCNNGVMKLNLFDLVAKIKPQFTTQIQCPLTLSFENLSVNGVTYTWFFGNGDSLSSNSSSIQYQYQKPGTYTIRLKAINPRTCRYQAFADTILIIPDPFPFQPDTLQDLFCAGDTLRPHFQELAPYKVSWKPNRWVSDPTSYKPKVYPLGSTTYKIEVTDLKGCKTQKTYALKNRKLTLDFTWTTNTDPCTHTHTVVFTSTKDTTVSMKWDFGDSTFGYGRTVAHTYIKGGRYEASLSCNLENCEENAFKSVILTEVPNPVLPDFTTNRQYNGCTNATTVFINQSSTSDGFLWDFGDGYQTTEFNPVHLYEKAGVYQVKLLAFKEGCRNQVVKDVIIEELAIPNLITSNEDSKNEVFRIGGLQPGTGLELFDRWGKKIFTSDNYQNDWKPDKVESGTYFFNLRFSEGSHCNGWVEIFR